MSVLQSISPNLYMWSELHGESRNRPYVWNSYAVRVPGKEVFVLIDPLGMSEAEVGQLERIAKPTHVLTSCEYHLRESLRYRERWGCQLLVNRLELERYDVSIDAVFESGERLWNHIDAVFVPETKFPETAFRVDEAGGVLIIGEVLSGGRQDHGIPDGGLGIVGPQYIRDLSATRKSLAGLLDLEFEVLCFGHGTPIFDKPKDVLHRFIDSDDTWCELERFRQERGPMLAI